ncbi:MAG: DNA internalization-related competence protein ComEC/Rec2 [Burkholderiales bacterium]|jgi:competence protein ComEC|nr:DNA internalization-related competence protein ComEC/Rec2 [Betaproteobacteria bacterium]
MRSFVVGLVLGCFFLQTRSMLPEQPAWATVVLSLLMALSALGFVAGRPAGRASDKSRHRWTTFALASSAWMISGALLGVGYAQYRAETRLADALFREWEGRDIELVGAVVSLPTLTERGTRFMFEVDASSVKAARVPRNISLTWYIEPPRNGEAAKHPPSLSPGERWTLTVRLRRPHGTANPHGFDFEAWALERNIRATGYVRFKGINKKEPLAASGMMIGIDRARLAIRDRMQAVLKDQPYAGVLIALAIGEQNAIPAAQWKTFWRTGTGHLMSISGLHITMVAALLYWLAFRLWARLPHLTARIPAQRVAAIVGAATALAYSLIAGFSVPTQRTFFMLLVVAIALTMGRGLSASRILAFALFGVVLLDPWCVLAPGFWLSFGAVAMIFYVTSHRTGQLSVVRAALLTQLAVTLGLLPLTLALFQEVSMISPVANAIAIPVVSWVVVPITLLGALLPAGLSDLMLILAHWVMSLTYDCLAWLAAMPNAVWQSHAPAMWTVALAMIGVVVVMMPRGLPMRWMGAAAILPMFFVFPPTPKPGELWVTLLDVGQGLATVVRTATHTLVYDTGPKWNPDADSGNRIVVPFLRGEGIRKLDALVVTHDDEDHAGGARSVIDARSPGWVLTSVPNDREYLANATEVMRCEVGDGWRWDGVEFDVLHPTSNAYEETRKTNNMGCVIKITAPGGTVLMTADIEKLVEAELVARAVAELKSDVLVVPHHGSKTSSTEALLDAVNPTLAVLPVGYRNRFRHPHPDVEARYAARNIPIRRTDWEGAITLKFAADAKGEPAIESYRSQRQRYWTDMPEKKIVGEP